MSEPTLADYAELWAKAQGIRVAERETAEWLEMYERWIDYAFADFYETTDDPLVRERAVKRGQT